jgi:hypothetical membrane protein
MKRGGGDSSRRAGSALVLIAGTIFLILTIVAEAAYPGYSVRTNALSDLGALGARSMLIWDGQLFASGALTLAGAYLLFFRSAWGRGAGLNRVLVVVLYFLPAIGTIIVALFPENFAPAIHLLGAFLVFTLGGFGAIYVLKLTKSPFRYYSVALGALSLGSTPLLWLGAALGFGLVERLVVYPYVIWLVAFGAYVLGYDGPAS